MQAGPPNAPAIFFIAAVVNIYSAAQGQFLDIASNSRLRLHGVISSGDHGSTLSGNLWAMAKDASIALSMTHLPGEPYA